MKYFLALLLLTISRAATAQITVTLDDLMQSVHTIISGATWHAKDTTGLAALLRKNGTNQVWDFSTFAYSLQSNDASLSIADYPDGAAMADDPHFTTANKVLVSRVNDTLTRYTYVRATPDGWWTLGSASRRNGTDILENYNEPPSEDFKLPVSYLSSWISNYTYVGVVYADTIAFNEQYAVDAYGTVILPGNVSIPVVRVVNSDSYGTSYYWANKSGYWIQASSSYGPTYSQPLGGAVPRMASEVTRFEVYPNPASSSVRIAHDRGATLEVFDAVGRRVYQTSKESNGTVDEIDVSRFVRGSYLVRVTDAKGTRTTPLLVQ